MGGLAIAASSSHKDFVSKFEIWSVPCHKADLRVPLCVTPIGQMANVSW